MPLDFQEIDIDMTGQLDTKSDPKNVVQTNLDTADNVVYTKNGNVAPRQSAQSLNYLPEPFILNTNVANARQATTVIDTSPALNPYATNYNTLYKNGEQVLASDGYRMMAINRAASKFRVVGMHAPAVSEDTTVTTVQHANNLTSASVLFPPQVAEVGNYRIYAYCVPSPTFVSTSDIYFRVEDITNGSVVIQDSFVARGTTTLRGGFWLVITSSGASVFFTDNTRDVTGIFWQSADPANYTLFYQANYFAGVNIKAASYNPSSSNFAAIIEGGVTYLRYYSVSASGLNLSSSVTVDGAVAATYANLAPNTASSEAYDVVYLTGAGVTKTARVNTTLTIGPVIQPALGVPVTASDNVFIKQESASGKVLVGSRIFQSTYNTSRTCWYWISDITHVKDTSIPDYVDGYRFEPLRGAAPVVYNRQICLSGNVLDSGESGTGLSRYRQYKPALLVVNSKSNVPEISYCGSIKGDSVGAGGAYVASGSSEISVPYFSVINNGNANSPGAEVRFGLTKVQFAVDGVVGCYAEYNAGTVVAGGCTKFYDGSTLSELGFLGAPVIGDVTISGAGGIINGQTYTWCAVYTWMDANGRKHSSRPSFVFTLTAGANGAANVVVYKPAISSKIGVVDNNVVRNIYVEVYRTQAGQSGPFYKVKTVSADGVPGVDLSDTITVVDNVSDANAAVAEQLYTTGGVLENETPPPISSLCVYADRLFAIDTDRNRVVYFKSSTTQEYSGYSSLLYINVGNPSDKLSAIAALDQTVLAFTDTKTFQAAGFPANDQGAGASIDSFLPIASEVGCPYPKSILPFQGGLFIYTYKGFYLLDRGANCQYIGAPVESYIPGNVCTGASLVFGEGTWQARFMMASSGRSTSFILCFDTQLGKWSRHLYASSAVGGDIVWADGSLWFSGVVPGLSSSFFREDPPRTNTATENFTCVVRTGWISPFGRMHAGRIRRVSALLDYPVNGSDLVTMTIETNYGNPGVSNNTTTSQQYTLEYGTGLYTLGQPSISRLRLRTKSQRAESFRVQLSWTKQNPYQGAWTSLTAFSAEVAGMVGSGKLPLTQTMNNT